LLRDLLDHFHGDVQKAIGAYNGGTKTPNPNYAIAVTNIAEYARRVLEHAPVLKAEDPVKLMTTNPRSPWALQSANAPGGSSAPK
jgi:soluble lytic murein transglycosylase-like protein